MADDARHAREWGKERSKMLSFRVTEGELEELRDAAKRDGMDLSPWIRDVLLLAARLSKRGVEAEGVEPSADDARAPSRM